MQIMSRVRRMIPGIMSVFLIILFWKFMSIIIGSTRLAPPEEVFKLFFTYPFGSLQLSGLGIGGNGSITPHIISTIQRYLIGVVIGSISGITFGLILAYNNYLREFLAPPIEIIRTIPPIAIIPFFVMWIGPKPLAQILMIILYSFLMLLVNVLNAVDNISPDMINFAQTLGANRQKVFTTVILPAIIPELIGGIRVVLAFSWGIEIVSEMVGTSQGLGMIVLYLIPVMLSAGIIAIVFWVVLVALFIDSAFVSITRRFIQWMPEQY